MSELDDLHNIIIVSLVSPDSILMNNYKVTTGNSLSHLRLHNKISKHLSVLNKQYVFLKILLHDSIHQKKNLLLTFL